MMQDVNKSLEEELLLSYAQHADLIGAKFPLWFNVARRDSAKCLQIVGLPEKKDERYGLTNVKGLLGNNKEVFITDLLKVNECYLNQNLPLKTYSITMTNGLVEQGLEVLNNGVAYGSLSAAAVDYELVVKNYLNSVADTKVNSIAALNHLFMRDGAFIYVPKGVKEEVSFEIDCVYGGQNSDYKEFARTLIVIEEGAEANVIIHHRGDCSGNSLTNHLRETVLCKNAKLNLSELIFLENQHKVILENHISQAENSNSNVVFVSSGSSHSRLGYTIELRESQANANVKGLYIVGTNQTTDININLNHLAANCTSEELIKGLGASNGVGSFAGRIYVAPNAQQTVAGQQSNNLMLSNNARIYSKPQLEIYADDVKCNHGATVGQLNDEAIYYMRQRGISEDNARKLQLSGFINDIVSQLDDQDLASFVYSEIAKKIENL